MNKLKLISFAATLIFLLSCGDDDDETSQSDLYKQEGYVIAVQTPGQTEIAKYFETLPEPGGVADLSVGGTDYANFFPRDVFDNALYMADPNDDDAMVKVKVRQDESFEIVGSIPVGERGVMMHIRDEGLGVLHDESEKAITVFDPISMTEIGEINMEDAYLQADEFPRYMDFYFSGNLVYALTRTSSEVIPDSLTVHVANVQTGQFIEEQYINQKVTTWAGGANSVYTENGDAYFGTLGDLENLAPALLFKIDASSGLDESYQFNVAQTLNPANLALQNFYLEKYIGNNKAIGTVAVDTPAEIFALLQERGGFENFTEEDQDLALSILFTAKNGAWCIFDLVDQTVEIIPGLPNISSFAVTSALLDGEIVYLPIASDENNEYYSYNINTGEVAKAFDVVGGTILSIHSLTQD
ncbi:MAG: hypothetical protein AAGG59_17990 [Bacteroidota bacterium]